VNPQLAIKTANSSGNKFDNVSFDKSGFISRKQGGRSNGSLFVNSLLLFNFFLDLDKVIGISHVDKDLFNLLSAILDRLKQTTDKHVVLVIQGLYFLTRVSH
jgi:hypothetical protein